MPRPFNTSSRLGQRMLVDGWSVKSLASVSGINERMLSDYLAGRRQITSKHLVMLATALECSPGDLT